MKARFEKTVTIMPSQIDAGGRLGVPDTFALFMDAATEAAGEIGVGMDFLRRKGMFWITVKTMIRFVDRPGILDTVQVSTWPEAPGEKRCNRHYAICRDGKPLVLGKTEWAIVSVLTKRPQRMAGLLPGALDYPAEAACPEPFPMIDERFDAPPFAEHRVVATDIDLARHMNNVAYVRAIVNAFSVKEWKRMDVREMTVIFRAPAHEGDTLQFRIRQDGGVMDVCGRLPGGQTVVLARMRLGR